MKAFYPIGNIPVDSSPLAKGGCFCPALITMPTERAIAYIDGFNLYHAIADLNRPDLKWGNLWSLSSSFLRAAQTLVAVNDYSAYATWRPGAEARHRQYTAALESVGVTLQISEFKERDRRCDQCGAQWVSHEEKETDVRMSIDIVTDALTDRFDLAIVVTADSDMKPAVARVRSMPDKKVLLVAPPKRFAQARALQPNIAITPGRIAKHLLPREVSNGGQVVATRPPQYDQP